MATVVTPEEEEHAASVLAALSGIERPSRGDGRIHNINISSSDGRRININASPSGGRPRMFVNRNNTGTQTGNNGGRHQMPMMGPGGPMLPPLEPQPVPNQTASDAVDGKKEDGDPKDMKKYECGICFEYMDYPVGCGSVSCPARFCGLCLRKAQTHENPTSNTEFSKCPTCRSNFIQPAFDRELRKEIADCTDKVTCPFEGCGAELNIGLLKAHEAGCPHMRIRCRFSDWGCEWVGRRGDLADHDKHQCEFRGGLGKLVERYRQGDAQCRQIVQQHHFQIAATSQMLSLHSRQIMMARSRNAWNVFDVLQLAYEASLFPGRFSAMKETWSSMIVHQEARCAVCNVMLMMPSFTLIFHVSLQGFKILSRIHHEASEADAEVLVDMLFLSLSTGILGILCIVAFYLDKKVSSMDWTIYNIGNVIVGQPISRDLAAVCMATAHFGAIHFYGIYPGVMLWHFIAIVTVFYTSFVCRIIEKNETSTSNVIILKSARAWPVVIFGLRYGLLVAMFDSYASLYAVMIMRILKEMNMLSSEATEGIVHVISLGEESECFISQFGASRMISIVGLATAIDIAMDFGVMKCYWLDLVFAIMVLVYTNASIYLLEKAGRKFGETNFDMGNKMFMQANRSGAVLPNVRPTSIGCLVVGLCSFLLACIAVV